VEQRVDERLVAALMVTPSHDECSNGDNDDDDLSWLTLWSCQALKRIARHGYFVKDAKPILESILARYKNSNNNITTTAQTELQELIIQEAWSALKHLQARQNENSTRVDRPNKRFFGVTLPAL